MAARLQVDHPGRSITTAWLAGRAISFDERLSWWLEGPSMLAPQAHPFSYLGGHSARMNTTPQKW